MSSKFYEIRRLGNSGKSDSLQRREYKSFGQSRLICTAECDYEETLNGEAFRPH
jgi:hypothetical protein